MIFYKNKVQKYLNPIQYTNSKSEIAGFFLIIIVNHCQAITQSFHL